MKANYIYNYDFITIDKNESNRSTFSICLCADIGFEYFVVVTDYKNTYPVSLNPLDPIEDIDIPEDDWKIIQEYIDKFGGSDGLLDMTQDFYNKYMSPEERDEYHKNDIKKEIEIKNSSIQ